jgi:cytochrome c5
LAVTALIGVALLVAIVYGLTVARFATVAGGPGTPNEIAARVAPVGTVNTGGDAAPAPQLAAAAPAEAAAPANPVYTQSCAACHATGAAGAPKLGDAAAWGPRIALGMDELMHTVLKGKGAMPPRGTCMACSDEDLRAAVEYMVSQVP